MAELTYDQSVWEMEDKEDKYFVMTAVHSFLQSYVIDDADLTDR